MARNNPSRRESIERDKCIISLREEEELSYAKIGELCGNISRQAVHQRYKKPPYSNAGRPKSPEIRRKHNTVAFLLSIGYGLMEVSKLMRQSVGYSWVVAKKYNLRYKGRKV